MSAILGHSTSRMLLELYAHESEAEESGAGRESRDGWARFGHTRWAEQEVWRQSDEKVDEKVVDGRRLELPTSALRTSPVGDRIWLRGHDVDALNRATRACA